MKFGVLIAGSQARRLATALILAIPVPAFFLFMYLSIHLQYPAAPRIALHHKEVLILRNIMSFFLMGFGIAHLALDFYMRKRSCESVFHFSLLRLFVCALAASLFIGANIIPLTSPAFEIPNNGNFGTETITYYGFPRAYECVTSIHSITTVLKLAKPEQDPIGLIVNGVILLLLIANILVLKLGNSKNETGLNSAL